MSPRVFEPEIRPVRWLLTLPPVALVLSGVALLLASAGAWGVADHVGYEGWVPPAGGAIMALPLIAVGLIAAGFVWERTSQQYRLYLGKVLPAWAFLVAIAALGVAYIVTIDNPETYEGSFNTLTETFEPNLTLETFFFVSVGLSVFLIGAIYLAMRFLYLSGIERPGLAAPEGIDPIGSLISEREATR